jgi:DNA-binding transcriptional LysR family regulator
MYLIKYAILPTTLNRFMHSLLRDVEYFAAIAEHGQVQLAAEALGLSQPALSISLRRLEKSMQTKLLKRTPQGVELTSVGKALLARVGKLRLSVEDVTREIADLSAGRTGRLRVASNAASALDVLPMACEVLMNEAPGLSLKVAVLERGAMLTGVRNGELDFALCSNMPSHQPELADIPLYEEEYVVYASANHRLAKRKQLKLADLASERWAVANIHGPTERHLTRAFDEAGLPPPMIAIESTFLPMRHHLLATSRLLGINSRAAVNYAAARFPVVELPVKDFSITRRCSVVHRKDAYLPPAALRFIEILKAKAKEITAASR